MFSTGDPETPNQSQLKYTMTGLRFTSSWYFERFPTVFSPFIFLWLLWQYTYAASPSQYFTTSGSAASRKSTIVEGQKQKIKMAFSNDSEQQTIRSIIYHYILLLINTL